MVVPQDRQWSKEFWSLHRGGSNFVALDTQFPNFELWACALPRPTFDIQVLPFASPFSRRRTFPTNDATLTEENSSTYALHTFSLSRDTSCCSCKATITNLRICASSWYSSCLWAARMAKRIDLQEASYATHHYLCSSSTLQVWWRRSSRVL